MKRLILDNREQKTRDPEKRKQIRLSPWSPLPFVDQLWTTVQGGRPQAEHSGFVEFRRHRFEFRGTDVTVSYGAEVQKGDICAGK